MERIKDKDLLQDMIDQLFPHRKSYAVNSMTPTLVDGVAGKKLAMLVIGDQMVEEILWALEELPEILPMVYLEDNKYDIGKDLVISFLLVSDQGSIRFETSIVGDEKKAQNLVLGVLAEPAEIGIFVVNEEGEVIDLLRAYTNPEEWSTVWDYFDGVVL